MISVPVQHLIQFSSKFKDKYKQIDFIPIEFDSEVVDHLWECGIDYHKGYILIANLLRDVNSNSKTYVGLRYVGEIRTDKEFMLSSRCSAFDRIVIAENRKYNKQDRGLNVLGDLRKLNNSSYNSLYKAEDILASQVDEDYEKNLQAIEQLNLLIYQIRGDSYNEFHNMNSYQEWLAKLNK